MNPFRRSPETDLLVGVLRTLKPGDVMTLGQLSAAVGFDVEQELPKLYNAREILLKEQHAKIDLRNREVRRLTDQEVIEHKAQHFRRKAGKAAARGANSLYSVDYQALPDVQQKAHNTGLAMFGAVRAALSARVVRKIEAGTEKKFLPSDAVSALKK